MDETVLYKQNPAMYKRAPIGFILTILLCVCFGVGLLILLPWWLASKAQKLTVTDERILLEKGLLSKNSSEVYLSDVRNVKVSQTLMQRWTKVGKVEISTAGQGDIEISAPGMRNPNDIKKVIDEHRRAKQKS